MANCNDGGDLQIQDLAFRMVYIGHWYLVLSRYWTAKVLCLYFTFAYTIVVYFLLHV